MKTLTRAQLISLASGLVLGSITTTWGVVVWAYATFETKDNQAVQRDQNNGRLARIEEMVTWLVQHQAEKGSR